MRLTVMTLCWQYVTKLITAENYYFTRFSQEFHSLESLFFLNGNDFETYHTDTFCVENISFNKRRFQQFFYHVPIRSNNVDL